MVKIENKYEVKLDNEDILIKRIITTKLTQKEALAQLTAMSSQIVQKENEIKQMEESIMKREMESHLKDKKEEKQNIAQVYANLNLITRPFIKSLKSDLKTKIRREKVKVGYSRMKDKNQRIVASNSMLSKIATDFDLDVNTNFMKELRRDFDKI